MQAKLLSSDGERVFAPVFETGEDPVAGTAFSNKRCPRNGLALIKPSK